MAKKVLLGVSGCIAAYKACEIVRGLQKAGCEVQVVMTENATEFVGPHTFSALCGSAALVDGFADPSDAIPHIRLAEECDLFLVAPCTANVAAKIAAGGAGDTPTPSAPAGPPERPAAPPEVLAKKYAEAGAAAAVDDDLARLKKEMGME